MSTPATPVVTPVVSRESESIRKVGNEWIASYQPKDEWGNPVGTPQIFKGKTLQEVTEKVIHSNQNATVALHKAKRAQKLEILLSSNTPDEPIPTFEPRSLSADERYQISEALKNPEVPLDEAVKELIEATFGLPIEKVRETLQNQEIAKRGEFVQEQSFQFVDAHPEYIPSEEHRDLLARWIEKRNLPFTKENFELAFEELVERGLMPIRASKPEPELTPEPVPANPEPTPEPLAPEPVAPQPDLPPAKTPAEVAAMSADEYRAWLFSGSAQPSVPVIPAPVTPATPISEPAEPVRPSPSSSGLSSRGASAPQIPVAPKAPGITAQYINSLSASQYAEKLRDPEFRKAIDALNK